MQINFAFNASLYFFREKLVNEGGKHVISRTTAVIHEKITKVTIKSMS